MHTKLPAIKVIIHKLYTNAYHIYIDNLDNLMID